MNSPSVLVSLEHEQSVLGAVLVGADGRDVVATLTVDEQLRPDHFWRPTNRRVFEAMLAVADRGDPVDTATVWDELERGHAEVEKAYLFSLPVVVPSVGSFRSYARVVRERARFRRIVDAGRQLAAAAEAGDLAAVAAAERMLADDTAADRRRLTIGQRQEQLVNHVEQGQVVTWPWPFRELDDMTGGIWPGQLTVIAGFTSHGKSVVLDQILGNLTKHGVKCAVYLNEMTALERDLRFVARRADISLMRLMLAKLRDQEHRPFAKAIQELPFDVVPAAGMTAREIVRDIRRNGWQAVGIDLLNGLPGSSRVEDIDENVRTLANAAVDLNCAVFGCQHLNRGRLVGAYPPEPSLGDIRGSGQIADLAHNVMFVYRYERKVAEDGGEITTGKPGDDSYVDMAKARMGQLGRVDVVFQANRMRFVPLADPGSVGRMETAA